MAKYEHFEHLPVWQEAARLYNTVLDLLKEPGVPLTPAFATSLIAPHFPSRTMWQRASSARPPMNCSRSSPSLADQPARSGP